MKRFDALQEIARALSDQLVVCNIGVPSKELHHLRDRAENFYMLGSMGLASSIALGLALARPDRWVWCVEGDGSVLMNLGSLCTIGSINPHNLVLLAIDNGSYGSTGDQPTHACRTANLGAIAKGAGINSVIYIENQDEIAPKLVGLRRQCHFIHIRVDPGNTAVDNIPLHPREIKERFISALKVH